MTTSLRMEDSLHERLRERAAQEDTSVNDVIVSAVRRYLDERQADEWRQGFEAMADDPDTNVEYAIHAQSEVVLGR